MADPELLRVLFIEDSEDDAALIMAALRRAGYAVQAQRVDTAPAMAAALEAAAWDVVVADYSLPNFSGPAALGVLHASGHDLPFILISGTVDEEQAVEALKAGAHDFISKQRLARLAPAIERERREAANRQEHRAADARLREREASFRLLFASNPLPMWVYDVQTLMFLEVNEAAVIHYGYSRDDFLGMTINDVRSPAELARRGPLVAGRLPATNRTGPWQHRAKSGALFDVDLTSHQLDFAGRPARLVVINDITARHQAEAAREQSEALFRALFELSPDAVVLIDPHDPYGAWPIVDCNLATCRLNGFTRDELIGHSIDVLNLEPGTPEARADYMRQLRQSPTIHFETFHRRKDGTKFPVEVSTSLIQIGGRELVIGIDRDITERRQAETALQAAEAKYRTLIEQIPAITYVAALDDTGSTAYVSPQVARLGFTPQDYLANPSLWSDNIHPDDRARVMAELDAMREATGSYRSEYRVFDRNGRMLWLQDEAVIVRDDAGRPLFHQGVVIDITERKLAEAQIQRQFERLAALRAIELAITSSLDLRLTLDVVLDQVIAQLGVHAADILLADPAGNTFTLSAARGFRASSTTVARLRQQDQRALRAARERRILSEFNTRPAAVGGLRERDGFDSYFGAPLLAKGQVLGVLELFHRDPLQPDPEWYEFLEALAGQAAIAIDSASLFHDLQRSNAELIAAYDATIEGWSRALDLRDKETEGHSRRVTDLTLQLAAASAMSEAELVHVRRGALLHDIGKMGVPDHILLKPDQLSDEEWVIMRQHPTFARDLLAPVAFLQAALDIPYCHHERWDGAGYPRGLAGEQIPLAARLFAVVDVWDALTSTRPYRPAWSAPRALEHIQGLAGSHFDPRAARLFLDMMR